MKHLIMTLFAAVIFTFTSLASEPVKETRQAEPKAKKEVVQQQPVPEKAVKAFQDCINVTFSCGLTGTSCCLTGNCSLGDLIIAAAIADPYICSGYSEVIVIF